MDFECRVPRVALLEMIMGKLRDIAKNSPCSFCGKNAQRDIVGVHWMTIDDDFAYLTKIAPNSDLARMIEGKAPQKDGQYEVKGQFGGPAPIKNPGHLACAVFTCSNCGNISLLSLNHLKILNTTTRPKLRLING